MVDTVICDSVRVELQRLEQVISDLESRRLEPDLFKKIRLQFGIYSIRDDASHYMVRVGIPLGKITPDQLEGVAALVEQFASNHQVHLTTRQDFQVYGIERCHLVPLLRGLAQLGLSSRETSGNVVRNVVCCPYAGVAPDEPFDVTPYALAVHRYFLRNPLTQLMPRKIKIAFEGCPPDHVRISVHDLGVAAAMKNGARGFQIYVGGGLGAVPRAGHLLETWTGEQNLLPTLEAVIRVFDRYGDRYHRGQARLKFLIEKMGWKEFETLVLAERTLVWATQSGRTLATIEDLPGCQKYTESLSSSKLADRDDFKKWCSLHVFPQKQSSFVSVVLSKGEVDAQELRLMARWARRYAGEIRLTNEQGFLFRFVPEDLLPGLYKGLRRLGFTQQQPGSSYTITHCLGAECCLTAITRPRGVALALSNLEKERHDQDGLEGPLAVKISGCPNACSQHHVADIGLYGVAVPVGTKYLPAYQILVGGGATIGRVQFAQRLARVPARRSPEAIRRLLEVYRIHRRADESFALFVQRVGSEFLLKHLTDLTDLTVAQPELFMDLGATEPFELKVGVSECAA